MLSFLSWHYGQGLATLLVIFANFSYFVIHFFSVPRLLKSLFTPFKRATLAYEAAGINPGKYFEVFSFNLISRMIGFIIRSLTLLCFVLAFILMLIVFLFSFFIFLLLPFVSLPVYLWSRLDKQETPAEILAGYGQSSNLLFQKIFGGDPSRFIFPRLEIGQTEYAPLFTSKNFPDEEKVWQETVKKVQPDFVSLVKVLAENFSPLSRLLQNKSLTPDDLLAVFGWYQREKAKKDFALRFWELGNLQKIKCLGKDWAYGYTVNLDSFSQDLNSEALLAPKLVGRDKEIEEIERILSKRGENNILLVGEPGVGKKTIIIALAQRIAQGRTTPALAHKRVLFFDLNSAIAQGATIERKRTRLLSFLKEAKDAGNIVLAIANFDKFASEGQDRLNLTEIFSQTIGASDLQVIGITTPQDYHRYLLPNTMINTLFETVEVIPPSKEQALLILENFVPVFEKKNKVKISLLALLEIIEKSDVLVTDVPFPEKAINLLDESVFFVLNNLKTSYVNKENVDKFLSEKTKIPLTELTKLEKEKLLGLEDFLHQRIIDQEEAIETLGKALRRGRLRITSGGKPIASFLFLGPTGVGKTETAKALAALYFGSEEKLIRFDMAEFVGLAAVEKLIGTSGGQPGLLTTAIKDSPFAVLLLDEFEKTTSEVLNLFLTVFDEGYLKDTNGKSVSFTNLIIIATSNAAAEFIRQKVEGKVKADELSKTLLDYILKEQIFNPEFINRFDGVVVFKPLTPLQLEQIARLMMVKLNARLKKEHDFTVKVGDELIKQLSTQGYDPTFGARPMNRLIQDKIEAPLARMILEGKVKKGEEVEIKI